MNIILGSNDGAMLKKFVNIMVTARLLIQLLDFVSVVGFASFVGQAQSAQAGCVAKDFTSDGRIYFGQTYAASP